MKREGEMTLDLHIEHSSFQAVRQRPTTPPTTWRSALKDYVTLFAQGFNSVGFTLIYKKYSYENKPSYDTSDGAV